MPLNSFDAQTTRRLAIGLTSAAGALLITTLNLIGIAFSADKTAYAAEISESLSGLIVAVGIGLIALIMAEIAEHPDTPIEGHPHSKGNYLQSAFALLGVTGLGGLFYGGFKLISAVSIQH